MVNALSSDAQHREHLRSILESAQRQRARIELTPDIPSVDQQVVSATTIELLRDDDIVIAQPTIGGLTRPLAINESITMSLIDAGERISGTTRCLGRVVLPSGSTAGAGSGSLYGYRLAWPDDLLADDRRADVRVTVGFDLAPRALLYYGDKTDGYRAIIIDLSLAAAQVRTLEAAPLLPVGSDLLLTATLPEPVGHITDIVHVTRAQLSGRDGQILLGLTFSRQLPSLDAFLQEVARRRSHRLR